MRRHQHGRALRETLPKHLQIIKQQLRDSVYSRGGGDSWEETNILGWVEYEMQVSLKITFLKNNSQE